VIPVRKLLTGTFFKLIYPLKGILQGSKLRSEPSFGLGPMHPVQFSKSFPVSPAGTRDKTGINPTTLMPENCTLLYRTIVLLTSSRPSSASVYDLVQGRAGMN